MCRLATTKETRCCWCDDLATRNLDTPNDQCCTRHWFQWFVPSLVPVQ